MDIQVQPSIYTSTPQPVFFCVHTYRYACVCGVCDILHEEWRVIASRSTQLQSHADLSANAYRNDPPLGLVLKETRALRLPSQDGDWKQPFLKEGRVGLVPGSMSL